MLGGDVSVTPILGVLSIGCNRPAKVRSTFHFDDVLTSFSSQEDVFRATLQPLVGQVLAGYETTAFAYGQTGTGKTYTMEGQLDSAEGRGLVPRTAAAVLEALAHPEFTESTVTVSYLEIYNEELSDLLATAERHPKLDLKDIGSGRGVCCQGLSEVEVHNMDDILEVVRRAQEKRRVAETRVNARSSRSHSIFTMKVRCQRRVAGGELENQGKLHLVDLAGSECAKKGGFIYPEDTSQAARLLAGQEEERERRSINQSLLTLGRVITALREGSGRVPYRDSKLPLVTALTMDDDAFAQAETHRARGNELINKGDYADATDCYDKGLVALLSAKGPSLEDIQQLRAALHLNASLAHLRRGNLASAVDHASGALQVAAKTEARVKALYRRGLAQAKLLEHGHAEMAQRARADFEAALFLDPENAEARAQLEQLQSKLRAEEKDLNRQQRETFKNIFSGKPLYEASEAPPAVLRETRGREHPVLLSVEDVGFAYNRGEPVLRSVSLELRRAWCTGLVGMNASGKSTLARLLCNQNRLQSGTLRHRCDEESPSAPSRSRAVGQFMKFVWIPLLVLILAVGFGPLKPFEVNVQIKLAAALMLALTGAACIYHFGRHPQAGEVRHLVLYLSSETSDKDPGERGETATECGVWTRSDIIPLQSLQTYVALHPKCPLLIVKSAFSLEQPV
eukprot:s87_g1.t1